MKISKNENNDRPVKVGFLGFGKSNSGVFDYLLKNVPNTDFTLRCKSLPDAVPKEIGTVMSGRRELSDITEDILFLSPSARRDIPELKEAENRGVILTSDAEFFFQNTNAEVFALTGSDGKSTTATLTSKILSKSFDKVSPCGNIGDPLTPHLSDSGKCAYVAELSSFQLNSFKPKSIRSAITNITKNHLNWHKSFDEYINAKENILVNSSSRVYNFDCKISRGFIEKYPAFAVFSTEYSEKELISLVKADIYITLSDDDIILCGEKYLNLKDFTLSGLYNVKNLMCAIALSYGYAEKDEILALISDFHGLPHRSEHFATYNGVKFIDSSIDSSPKRTKETLSASDGEVFVILGGKSKGLDYNELVPTLDRKAKAVIISGENADEIENTIKSGGFPYLYRRCIRTESLYSAAMLSCRLARAGDTVFLSPASTSFDAFRSFEERGDFFKKTINNIYRNNKGS